jgi:hypothetical protein
LPNLRCPPSRPRTGSEVVFSALPPHISASSRSLSGPLCRSLSDRDTRETDLRER